MSSRRSSSSSGGSSDKKAHKTKGGFGGILERYLAEREKKAASSSLPGVVVAVTPLEGQSETAAPKIVISQNDSDKIIVTLPDNRRVEADRWCPHKQADLSCGWLDGTKLVCPKHKWEFDMAQGGICTKYKKSLKSRLLQW
jgi:nitrite reductase/ring-hydroxylating ferredoxin subunit